MKTGQVSSLWMQCAILMMKWNEMKCSVQFRWWNERKINEVKGNVIEGNETDMWEIKREK